MYNLATRVHANGSSPPEAKGVGCLQIRLCMTSRPVALVAVVFIIICETGYIAKNQDPRPILMSGDFSRDSLIHHSLICSEV